MRSATITRQPDDAPDADGVFGDWLSDSGLTCRTLERPRTGDHPCIPKGSYLVKQLFHQIHGLCYELLDVPGRTAILVHPANWYFELLGCVAPGEIVEVVEGEWQGRPVKNMGVSSSRAALARIVADFGNADFVLTIK